MKTKLQRIFGRLKNVAPLTKTPDGADGMARGSTTQSACNITLRETDTPSKAQAEDYLGRFREIVSDPLNLLIERHPMAGVVIDGNVVVHNGNIVSVEGPDSYYGKFSDILIINRGVHEPLEEYVFQEVLKLLPETPTMLELGAYWGHYSMWLKQRRPESKVFLVEPDKNNIRVGKINFAKNNMNGEFINEFVQSGKFEVDKFVSEQSIGRLNILHADIQGYELEMLNRCKITLKNEVVDFVFISTHSRSLHAGVIKNLKRYNYRIEVDSDLEHETTSHDGLVFASRSSIAPVFSNFHPLGRRRIAQSKPQEIIKSITAP